jgi:hypothetical protein
MAALHDRPSLSSLVDARSVGADISIVADDNVTEGQRVDVLLLEAGVDRREPKNKLLL